MSIIDSLESVADGANLIEDKNDLFLASGRCAFHRPLAQSGNVLAPLLYLAVSATAARHCSSPYVEAGHARPLPLSNRLTAFAE